jgi:diaminopimelate decarboxylase
MATARDEEGFLTLGGVRLASLARDPRIGTPSYVYDVDAIAAEARALDAAFDGAPHLVAYAVKANAAGPIVRALAAAGCGADVVSGAELLVALGSGIVPEKIVFSGVGKTVDEIDRALMAGDRGILAIQAESVGELLVIHERTKALDRRARVALRVNPEVELAAIDTHAHIATGHDEAKFGIPRRDLADAIFFARSWKSVDLVGLTSHVGSQFTSTEAYVASARTLFDLARGAREAGAKLQFVDTGGGFGVDYDGLTRAPRPAEFVRAVRAEQRAAGLDDLALNVEPGRSLVAAHGVLIASTLLLKRTPWGDEPATRRWLVIDAGMNDLIRPALYQARHRIVPLAPAPDRPHDAQTWRVVGPVCESSDDFGEHDLNPGDHVAVLDAGAYGYVMSSRYNGRPLPAEVFLRGGSVAAIAQRKPLEDWANERIGIEG